MFSKLQNKSYKVIIAIKLHFLILKLFIKYINLKKTLLINYSTCIYRDTHCFINVFFRIFT